MAQTPTNEQLLQMSGVATGDPLAMANSENPNHSLSPVLFDGNNFISWNRQIRMRLGAKMKRGFIDGTLVKPDETSKDFARWTRCDEMVACWILSSMIPELANSFIYTTTARDLWLEIMERYNQSNAALIYQVKQELMRTTQGNLTVTSYYTKLKKCWDDLQCMRSVPVCICGVLAKCNCKVLSRVAELDAQDQTMHFLINLNAEFEAVKTQILSMEPFPNLNKAYHLVLQIERQKQITSTVVEPVAFMAAQGNNSAKKEIKKPNNSEKKHCKVCNLDGHYSDNCFEVIGYPDWFKGKKKRTQKMAANVCQDERTKSTPLETEEGEGSGKYSNLDPEFVEAMCNQMMRMFQGKSVKPSSSVNFAAVNFAGPND